MKSIKVKVTFLEEVLGTSNSNPDIHEEFIASKALDAMSTKEEVEALGVEAVVEKGTTIFPKLEDGTPIFWDYQWKGFFKDTCSALRKVANTESSKCKAFKKQIDGLIFVEPRKIPISLNGKMDTCQRPLRAQTMQGERVALANSETAPAGSTCEFTVKCLVDSDAKMVKEWLDYGVYRGMGAWRNSGKGRFAYKVIDE